MTIRSNPRRWSARLLALAGVALATTAGLAASAAGSASKPGPAKGKPIVLAMINQEAGFAAFPQWRQAAQAAIKYVNTVKSGVHGRPLTLVTCSTDGTPPASAACANRLLDQHPIAVVAGFDLGSSSSTPIFEKAGLAYIGASPTSAQDSSSPSSIQFAGGLGSFFGAVVSYTARGLHARKVAVIYTSEPAGQFALNAFVLPGLKALGITDVKTVSQDPTATDWSASMAAAAGGNPDVIITTNPPAACVSIMKSHQALGISAKLFVTGACSAPALLAAAGDSSEGVLSGTFAELPSQTDNKDVRLFLRILKLYAPKAIAVDDAAEDGVAEIMNVSQVFNSIPAGKLRTANILKAFRTGGNHRNFLEHPYTCDGKQLQGAPAVCNPYAHLLVVHSARLTLADRSWWKGPS